MSVESSRTEPLLGSSSLFKHLSRDVFPAPEGPTIADTSCLANDAVMPLRTVRPPRSSETSFSSSAVDSTGNEGTHRAYGGLVRRPACSGWVVCCHDASTGGWS